MLSTKDYVLSCLIKAKDYISGESLSDSLNISRAAVNTAVKSLKAEGYEIDSVTRKGYKIQNPPDFLTTGQIAAHLDPKRMENIHVLSEVDSTNRYLKDLASSGAPSGTVVVSDCQTAGRGRLGRSFLSPAGTGIYLSYLMRPSVSFNLVSRITCWSAVAVADSISEVCKITPSVKWVNDIKINDFKICGILTEMSVESESAALSHVVIGIGINVNEAKEDFPPELRSIASSIREQKASSDPINRAELTACLIGQLDRINAGFPVLHEEYLSRYRDLCTTAGLDISVVSAHNRESEIPRLGKAVSVNDDFSLKVLFDDGHEEDLSSGEISVRHR